MQPIQTVIVSLDSYPSRLNWHSSNPALTNREDSPVPCPLSTKILKRPSGRWRELLSGRLRLKARRSRNPKPVVLGCGFGPLRRCPARAYCVAARIQFTPVARVEKWFWRAMLGIGTGVVLYEILG